MNKNKSFYKKDGLNSRRQIGTNRKFKIKLLNHQIKEGVIVIKKQRRPKLDNRLLKQSIKT